MKHLITLLTLGLGALLLSACGSTESGVCPITGARGPRPAGVGHGHGHNHPHGDKAASKADCCKSEAGKQAACCAKDAKGNAAACCKSAKQNCADKQKCADKKDCAKSACKSEAKAGCCSTKAACDASAKSAEAKSETAVCPVTGATGVNPHAAEAAAIPAASKSALPSCCSAASAS